MSYVLVSYGDICRQKMNLKFIIRNIFTNAFLFFFIFLQKCLCFSLEVWDMVLLYSVCFRQTLLR